MKKLEIGIEVAPMHAFGRAFVEGVSTFAITQKNWTLRALSQDTATVETLRTCAGAIVRVIGDRLDGMARDSGIPIVDIYCEKPRPHLAQVSTDEKAAGLMAAEFFLARGFVHFGFCGVQALAYSNACRTSFCRTIAKAGHAVSCYEPSERPHKKAFRDYDNPYRTPDAGRLRRWLKALPKPAAVFCCNDNRAYQVMQTGLNAEIAIPTELALLGCDNDTMLCSFAPVPISSIDPDAFKLGYSAAQTLSHMLLSPHAKPPPIHLIPPKGIVERDSTEIVPVNPPWLSDAILTIEKNLSRGISAREIFDLSGRSPPVVERIFRQKTGQTVQNYITDLRMKKAVSMLKSDRFAVKEVASACGYASPQYFCRTFKSVFGKTPGHFR